MLRPVLALGILCGVAHAGVDDVTKAAPACDAKRAHCFAIQLHVVEGATDGLVATPAWIAARLAAANAQFETTDVGFQVDGVDTVPASAAHVATRADRDALGKGRLAGTSIHVFVVGRLDDIDHPGNQIRGVTWHAHDRTYIVLSAATAPERTLAHELGHFFGLPHSTYPISIMNKTKRDDPPPEQRRFADEELDALRAVIARMVRDKAVAEIRR